MNLFIFQLSDKKLMKLLINHQMESLVPCVSKCLSMVLPSFPGTKAISTFFPVSSRCVAKSCRVTQQCSVSPSSRRRSDAQRSSSSATCASARSPMAQPRLGPMGDRRMVASYGWEYSITICYNPFLCQFLSI